MSRYNLLDEKWIRVIRNDTGLIEDISLLNLFKHAQKYKSLAGEMETQNFAVMRILLAILVTVFTRVDQAGMPYEYLQLDDTDNRLVVLEPVDEEDSLEYGDALDETWKSIWLLGKFPDAVCQYLEAWRERFYLLDDTYPFMQVTKNDLLERLPKDKKSTALEGTTFMGKQINRLISESNNKDALFSPAIGKFKSRMTTAELSRWLIMMHGYIGTSDKSKFITHDEQVNSKGWLYDLGGIYVSGDNLFETLWLNTMLNHIGNGKNNNDDSGDRYTISVQSPCWEKSPSEQLQDTLSGKPLLNLASLYTSWSRAVYLPPTWTEEDNVSIGAVKVTEIKHENNFLEPMTLWLNRQEKNGHTSQMPLKHQKHQSLWRSFGLLVVDSTNHNIRVPGIIAYNNKFSKFLNNKYIHIHAVSMLSDNNATSWMPIDEVTDILSIHEIALMDEGEDTWSIRILDTIEDTKYIVDNVYGQFLGSIAEQRGLEKIDFVKIYKSQAYEVIDGPFRDWLYKITPNESKDELTQKWKLELYSIIRSEAELLMQNLSERDYISEKKDKKEKKSKNSIEAYGLFKTLLNKRLGVTRV